MPTEKATTVPVATARLDGVGAKNVEQEIGEIVLPDGKKMKARVRAVLHLQIRPDRWVEAQMGDDIAKQVAEKLGGIKI
jgi:hypothetical protein